MLGRLAKGKKSRSSTSDIKKDNTSMTKEYDFWQDREIRFDTAVGDLVLRPNTEVVYASFPRVEDTQGNNGRAGSLLITNLRLIWFSEQRKSMNLSIGLLCVQAVSTKEVESRLNSGTAESLVVSTKYGSGRFRFSFTCINLAAKAQGRSANSDTNASTATAAAAVEAAKQNRQRLFTAVQTVWRAYESSKPFREVRVRNAMVANGNVITLASNVNGATGSGSEAVREQVMNKLLNVSNVSKERGTIGTMVITNIRVVWFANDNESFNVSIPYMQLVAVRTQTSKFGQALVLETSVHAGGFVLGFRIAPQERLATAYNEVTALWQSWCARPVLGVHVRLKNAKTGDSPAKRPGEKGSAPSAASATAEAGAKQKRAETMQRLNDSEAEAGMSLEEEIAQAAAEDEEAVDGAEVFDRGGAAPTDAFAAYYADEGQKGVDRRPVFDPTMGLAVEKLRSGVTMAQLWEVL